jgi:hypothetical protein
VHNVCGILTPKFNTSVSVCRERRLYRNTVF